MLLPPSLEDVFWERCATFFLVAEVVGLVVDGTLEVVRLLC
jgi:hypothetical protein